MWICPFKTKQNKKPFETLLEFSSLLEYSLVYVGHTLKSHTTHHYKPTYEPIAKYDQVALELLTFSPMYQFREKLPVAAQL